jgi:hypothetical protein
MEPEENTIDELKLFALKRQMEWLTALSDAFSAVHPTVAQEFALVEFKNLAELGMKELREKFENDSD